MICCCAVGTDCRPRQGGGIFNYSAMTRKKQPRHTRFSLPTLVACALVSLLGHGLAAVMLERYGPFEPGPAIAEPAAVLVDLAQQPPTGVTAPPLPVLPARATATASAPQPLLPPPEPPAAMPSPAPPAEPSPMPEEHQPVPPLPAAIEQQHDSDLLRQYLRSDRIFPHQHEKLVYRVSLAGIAVGHAHLEATNQDGELRIRSSVSSNSMISAIYPVQTSTDTRLIKGRYLLTRIRQQEGTMRSDTGFNLMYPDQKIFWVDRIRNRFSNEPLESPETLDFVSGLYFLRLQPLQVGDQLALHLYDGDTTTLVPVRVLRREQLKLPGLRSVATVVVQPEFAESGFFRNNRDLLFWFSDDHEHVPVRIEATTPIGRVVAELIASERTVAETDRDAASTIVPAAKMQYN